MRKMISSLQNTKQQHFHQPSQQTSKLVQNNYLKKSQFYTSVLVVVISLVFYQIPQNQYLIFSLRISVKYLSNQLTIKQAQQNFMSESIARLVLKIASMQLEQKITQVSYKKYIRVSQQKLTQKPVQVNQVLQILLVMLLGKYCLQQSDAKQFCKITNNSNFCYFHIFLKATRLSGVTFCVHFMQEYNNILRVRGFDNDCQWHVYIVITFFYFMTSIFYDLFFLTL
eukprot:TRINITY_DN9000_c1_g1_i2.p1 TRINITY_DN9000_c1_g1~~TRINITY_DN9000_c1_g1_i2.p1  ORF type:complete len:226 (-),score=-33.28 TRINITY_DN9000_c1_g1_i2:234-911(-)